jgi:dissimilatory sulfite reductase (desulfoviridin) alpha/beta subunit
MSSLHEIVHENVRESELYERLDRKWVRCFACGHCCRVPDEQLYDNTAHRRGYRVAAEFVGGELSKVAQTVPDWVAKLFGKELQSAKQHEKSGRGR